MSVWCVFGVELCVRAVLCIFASGRKLPTLLVVCAATLYILLRMVMPMRDTFDSQIASKPPKIHNVGHKFENEFKH